MTKAQTDNIAKKLREIADIFEEMGKTNQPLEKSKRGRKPGSVADEFRCTAEIAKGERCKNRSLKDGFCGKHTK